MRIAHTALWTRDIDATAAFWTKYFGASVGAPYHSQRRRGFTSRFVQLPEGPAQIELMTGPWLATDPYGERIGWDHVAISLGSKAAVDALAERCKTDGCLKSPPRMTGDGFYEAVIVMPDGTPIEVTA
ncbi:MULTISPECIES: glyoxalase/bleomycin resistance/extradiol dioxygenase family protein [unclassified Rhizobium]|jgi:lactoylglutathione lyase|uniref:glyoxalase/bleomycin resistance/extradiol dioxygenase family protein n=1 Tax=unclassified Rhizobium TaxID=2613769 RepID=UPI00064836D8|nr:MULTISPECIES: glyoxalase/bleomycin resistance/extradiol dioxygenase family protein [unclassified Rhizobium]MBN8951290.1 glyoxalase/bleomycin resistance/extradiol dioxygenase family protein [Rhizobium tropici]OJY74885.1 MAG: bleomycin resistance protein [Rhizobium sp. 60-20]RKD66591.1 lactoylglutathione lyase [Rhizobium sp. WW_1]